jgi:hypothetical protein
MWAYSIVTALQTVTTVSDGIYATILIDTVMKWSSESETRKRYSCQNTVTEIQT